MSCMLGAGPAYCWRQFHVDCVMAYTVWGNNDLWNLLSCDDQVCLLQGQSTNLKLGPSLGATGLTLLIRSCLHQKNRGVVAPDAAAVD